MTTPYSFFIFLRRRYFSKGAALSLFLMILMGKGYGQTDSSFEQISITLITKDVGNLEIPAIIHEDQVWLPVKIFFDFLGINSNIEPKLGYIKGNFIDPNAPFTIERVNNTIVYDNMQHKLDAGGLIYSDDDLFLRTDYFTKIFGLECNFNFRSLSVNLHTNFELPVVREQRQAFMRQNLSKLKAEKKADTVIKNNFSAFHFGALDWQINSLQEIGGRTNTRINLDVGGMIAGGEASAYFNYNSLIPFSLKNQIYNWKYVDNQGTLFKQVSLGRIFTQSTSSLYAPLNGIQITNRPTTYRKSFGSFIVSNSTEPNWIVELYVNNVLVDYTKADGSGFFTFDVPLVYGSSAIKFRYYGPWGEERSSEEIINIPYTFLPENQFEYSLSAGVLSDNEKSKFTRANLNYGLNSRITIGSGVEYLSSVESGRLMPFINASVRLRAGLILSGEHTYNVATKANLSYRFAKKLQLEVNYTKYKPGQDAVKINYLEEKKAILSIPFRSKNFNGFSRLTLNRITLGDGKFTSAEILLGGVAAGINCNLTTNAFFTSSPIIYSKLSATFRLPKGIRLTPQAQYAYHEKRFNLIRSEIEKQIFNKGFLNFSVERNIPARVNSYILGVRYNFSFARTSFYAKQSNHTTSLLQSASGGFMYDENTGQTLVNNIKNVGRSGILILPFLDFNCNGRRDNNEPDVKGLNARVAGINILRNEDEAAIRVTGLEAHKKYFVDLDENSFENTSWKIKNKAIQVVAEPNHFTRIEVPVSVVGEVSGTVYNKGKTGKEGIGRIMINIYNDSNQLVAKTLTEYDGYFNYLGLAPGKYFLSVDTSQLMKIDMQADTPEIPFTIQSKREGDIVDGLDLILTPIKKD